MIWGALSFIGALTVLVIAGYGIRSFGVTEDDKTDKASAADVRFVLNWCQIGDARTEKVLHSYESSRSFTGDHVDAYAIKVKDLVIDDLKSAKSDFDGGWIRCDKLSPVFVEATKLVSSFTSIEKLPWFPSESDLLSDQYYIWVWSIYMHGQRPTSAEIIYAHPGSGTIYYSSVKT